MDDLATFLQISTTNGWGGYVLTSMNYFNLFFSHDEYIEVYSDNGSLHEVSERFRDYLTPPKVFNSSGSRSRISASGVSLVPEEVHPLSRKTAE